jgi:hypothetical protein
MRVSRVGCPELRHSFIHLFAHTHTHPFFHSCAPMYSCHCVHSFIHASVRWVLSSSHLWVGPRSHDFLHRQFPVRVAIDDVEEPLAHQRVEVEHRVRRLDHLPAHLFLIGGWWWWTYGWIETGRVVKGVLIFSHICYCICFYLGSETASTSRVGAAVVLTLPMPVVFKVSRRMMNVGKKES